MHCVEQRGCLASGMGELERVAAEFMRLCRVVNERLVLRWPTSRPSSRSFYAIRTLTRRGDEMIGVMSWQPRVASTAC